MCEFGADGRVYYPTEDSSWSAPGPAALGFDPGRLAEAVDFARVHETVWPHDLRAHLEKGAFEEGPSNAILGPTKDRGAPSGVILRGGRIATEWGDTFRADMTFSVAKSYLSIVAGLAFDRNLIMDLDEPVVVHGRSLADDAGYDPPRNRFITWRHLLQQTSEWEGTLWGKPDMIDRHRHIMGRKGTQPKGSFRALAEPGKFWEYNDVRINRLALALLQLWRKPVAAVFRDHFMDVIGAGAEWRWHGYHNSTVTIDGQPMESVSGGGHWGGGVFINARDQARVGLAMLRGGMWRNRRLLSQAWIERSLEPCPLNAVYGLLWWLNTDRQLYAEASKESYFAFGAGYNITWIDPAHDLVVVLRWIRDVDVGRFIGLTMKALA
ncbi:MAG: serine hydrolase [Alphaproteobacteria bacterium]|nr:serine hydrolase [Alphaproteobacteria bacterium]